MKILRYYIFPLLCVLLAAACSLDEPDSANQGAGTGTTRVSIKLSAAANAQPKDAVSAVELIQSYRVIIAAPDGSVVRCIDDVCDPAVELDPIETTLSIGTYHVYAFANISKSYLDGLGLKEEGTVPSNISSIRYFVPAPFTSTLLLPVEKMTTGIPMTSARQVVTVTGPNYTFGIELRRLFAKLEFVFRNTTPQNLQVNALAVENMTVNAGDAGSILLMNYEEPRTSINLPSDLKPATLTHTFASPAVVASKGAEVHHSFYVLESQSSSVTNAFGLSFSVTKSGEAPTSAAVDHMRYGLTSASTITLIHRNDWIVIPITFSEWQMRLEVHSYAPIGGYPDAVIDENESGEFVAKFKSGGKFTLRPFIRKHYEGNPWFGVTDKSKVQGSPTIAISGDDLFEVVPALTSTGEIVGKMRSGETGKGTACITLSVNVIESTTPSLTTRTLTRKIYVTQE